MRCWDALPSRLTVLCRDDSWEYNKRPLLRTTSQVRCFEARAVIGDHVEASRMLQLERAILALRALALPTPRKSRWSDATEATQYKGAATPRPKSPKTPKLRKLDSEPSLVPKPSTLNPKP